MLTRSILPIINLVFAHGITVGLAITVSLRISLQFLLLTFVLAVVEPVIGSSVLLIAVLDLSIVPETPINQVLADEDHALDALVRGPLLLARIVYNQALLFGQERRRAGQ